MKKEIIIKDKIINYNNKSTDWKGNGYYYFPSLPFHELNIPQNARGIQLSKASFVMNWEWVSASIFQVNIKKFDFPFELNKEQLKELNLLLAKKIDGNFKFSGEKWDIASFSADTKFKAWFGLNDKDYIFEKNGIIGGMSSASSLESLKIKINMNISYYI